MTVKAIKTADGTIIRLIPDKQPNTVQTQLHDFEDSQKNGVKSEGLFDG